MTGGPRSTSEMTADELAELARGIEPLDPAAVPRAVQARLALHNRRALLLEALLRRARVTLRAGARIEPALADTIRFAARALQVSRARLLEGAGDE